MAYCTEAVVNEGHVASKSCWWYECLKKHFRSREYVAAVIQSPLLEEEVCGCGGRSVCGSLGDSGGAVELIVVLMERHLLPEESVSDRWSPGWARSGKMFLFFLPAMVLWSFSLESSWQPMICSGGEEASDFWLMFKTGPEYFKVNYFLFS